LTDAPRSGRPRATTSEQDQQVVALVEQQMFVTSEDIMKQLNKKGVEISQRTVRRRLNEAGAKYNKPLSKPLLTDNHREKRLKWAEDQRATDWNQVIISDETTIRMNSVKGLVWNLPGKKEGCANCQAPYQGQCLGLLFNSRFWSRRMFQGEPRCRFNVSYLQVWPLTYSTETIWS
jgi:Transposase